MKQRLFKIFSLTVIIAMIFGFAPLQAQAAVPPELFFSEYIEGSSYNKALEIYNPTGAAVDLAAGVYTIQQYSNGGTSASATITLTGTLAAGDVYVVTQGNAVDEIKSVADLIFGTTSLFNGDDAIVLRKNGVVIDAIGQVGFDPGTQWGVDLISTADNTLRRKCGIFVGDPIETDAFDPSIEWLGYANDTFGGLGTHEATCLPKINEFSANTTTSTDVEYVEIHGEPLYDFSTYSVLEIEGDTTTTPGYGVVDEVISLGTTDANGLYLANLANGTLENGTITLLLVNNFTGLLGNDLDTNDDGLFDVTPWDAIVDSVAVNDGGAGDITYGTPALGVAYDGLSFAPGGASRIPDGFDTDAATDWVRNDFDLAGIPTYTGTLVLGEAYNTPGALNAVFVPPPEACGDPYTLISAVQGNGLASPLVGTEVAVEGIVVGDFQNNASVDDGNLNGFHLQSADSDFDADPATSEGVFIYYSSNVLDVVAGDGVRVRGTISEYNGMTEITASQVWACSTGNVVTPTAIDLPADSLTEFEAYEGMLVTFPQDLIISEYFNYDQFGEIVLTSERHMTPTAVYEPGSMEYTDAVQAYLLDKITLDDGRSASNPDPAIHPNGEVFDLDNLFRGGDILTNVTGVVDYSFNLYRIQPTEGADYTPANPRPTAAPEVGGTLKVVSMNTLNYFTTLDDGVNDICGPLADQECRGADTQAEFQRQHAKLVAAILEMDPDVIGLIEVENNATDEPMEILVDGLNDALGEEVYAYVPTGAIGSDAIRAALIYKPATVSMLGDYAILDSTVDARFLDDYNRPLLAQTFQENQSGGIFTVAVNHLKSKGSSCDAIGDPDLGDGAGNCDNTREAAAKAEVDWLATDPTGSGDPDFLIIGDLNSYDKEDPIDAIKAGPDDILGTADDYFDLVFEFQGEDAYSYVFDGQMGYLDFAISGDMVSQVTGTSVWHVNADEPDLIDYDMSYKKDAQDLLYAPDPYRYSDHDPVIIGLDLVYFEAGGPFSVVENGTVALTVPPRKMDLNEGALTYAWDLDGDGIYETPGRTVTFDATGLAAPQSLVVKVQATNSLGYSTFSAVIVNVIYDFRGFLGQVDNQPILNIAIAGNVIPVKFSLNGDKGLDIFAAGTPTVEKVYCPITYDKNVVEKYVTLTDPLLSYNATKDKYKFTWQTDAAWAGTCQLFTIELNDGTTHTALFKFK